MTAARGYAEFIGAVATAMGLHDRVHRPGTTIIGALDRSGSATVVTYAIANHTVLWCDPALVETLSPMTDRSRARSLAEFERWAEGQAWKRLSHSHMQLLDQHGLRRPADDTGHEIRWLDRESETDRALVDAFKATLPDEDRDEADLDDETLDEHIVAVVDDRGIAAFASQQPFQYAECFADIAIATRPDARGRGLGRIAVAALCNQIEHSHLFPLYRRDADNVGSVRLSASLGFVPVLEILAYERR